MNKTITIFNKKLQFIVDYFDLLVFIVKKLFCARCIVYKIIYYLLSETFISQNKIVTNLKMKILKVMKLPIILHMMKIKKVNILQKNPL